MARPLVYDVRILLRLAGPMARALDSSLRPNETRLDFIRKAIAQELKKREQAAARKR